MAFNNHYSEVHRTVAPSTTVIETCLQSMEPKVTRAMNEALQKEFTKEEVEVALHQIGPLKSLGPNGYGAYFYQTY